jgi:hypothetical protein
MADSKKGEKYDKKAEQDLKSKIKSDLYAVKKLEKYAEKSQRSDPYNSLNTYLKAAEILYQLANDTQDTKYMNQAEAYKAKAEKLSDRAVDQLDDRGQITDATKLLAMLGNAKKAEAYAKKLEKRGDYGKAGTTYLLTKNFKKAREMAHYAIENKQTIGAASIVNQILDIELQETDVARKYEEIGARKALIQLQKQQEQQGQEQEGEYHQAA